MKTSMMRPRRGARAARVVTTLAAAALTTYGAAVAPARAAGVAPPLPRPRALVQQNDAGARLAPAWGLDPAAGRDCPEGSSRTATLASTTFDTTAAPFTSGMAIMKEGSASFARHVGTGSPVAQILASPALTVPAARLFVKFDVRGDFGAQDIAVTPRFGGTAWAVAPAAEAQSTASAWRTVHFDLTDGANEATLGQPFSVLIARDGADRSTVDIDNLSIYQCTPAPMAEPGDFNGDGFADAKFVMRDGNLLFSAGTPTQSRTLWRGGTGWASMTWIGSVGDTDGDGYSDLLARTATGDLLAYSGDGVRTFPASRRIGTGWQSMSSILTVGDVTGDGMQDLIARSGDGMMRFYSFTAGGTLAGGRIVGSGWESFTHIVAIRSTGSPGTPTRLYGILPSGDMKSYAVSSTGNMTGWGTRVGAGWAFGKVASVGDWDGDGLDDIVAAAADGTAYVYPTAGEGQWKPRKTLQERIWNAALLVG